VGWPAAYRALRCLPRRYGGRRPRPAAVAPTQQGSLNSASSSTRPYDASCEKNGRYVDTQQRPKRSQTDLKMKLWICPSNLDLFYKFQKRLHSTSKASRFIRGTQGWMFASDWSISSGCGPAASRCDGAGNNSPVPGCTRDIPTRDLCHSRPGPVRDKLVTASSGLSWP